MKLAVMDGNSVVNRAFYGVRLLSNSKGQYTNAIFGFLNILLKILEKEHPDYMCVAFDLHAPTFRHNLYEGYKATRKGMPDELASQMQPLKDILDALGIARIELEGFEADDIIGAVANECVKSNVECEIYTGDRDSLQLVGSGVTVRMSSPVSGVAEKIYDEQAVLEQYGMSPKRLIELKGLMGDSSDNIPGVAGIGPKTAKELLGNFDTIDEIYENIDSPLIKDSVRKKLEAGKDMAFVSRKLGIIDGSVGRQIELGELKIKPRDTQKLYSLFSDLEMMTFIKRLELTPSADGENREKSEISPVISDSFDILFGAERVFISLSEDCLRAALCTKPDEVLVASTDDPAFADIISNQEVKKCGYGFDRLYRVLFEKGISFSNMYFDLRIAEYLINASESNYDIDRICAANAITIISEKHIREAVASSVLFEQVSKQISQNGMDKLFFEVEMPLCEVLSSMTHLGVKIDRQAMEEYNIFLDRSLKELTSNIYFSAGGEFNINSTRQLGEVLFERLGLPHIKKTKTGYSTDVEVLNALLGRHPIIEWLLEYRTLSKLKSTYAEGLLKVIAQDGKIHSTFNQTVTVTGRISSSEPNLQNIPARSEAAGIIRKMFIPTDENYKLIDADYSQIELRVLSHIADDKNMQKAFLHDDDIHTITASQVFKIPMELVTPELRRRAKAVNFGIVYGISDFSLSQDIGVSRREAEKYISDYLENFSGVRQYMEDIVKTAQEQGFVTTLWGRRRYLPEIKSKNFNIRSFAKRAALNTPIQGSAADIMKVAMVRVYKRLKSEGLKSRLILSVHDELLVEVFCGEEERAMAVVLEEMERSAVLSVPLKVDVGIGDTWYSAKG